jgi:cobalamin biosynthetic protein CobC
MAALIEQPPRHGGDLLQAAQRFGIAPARWLDLSAALNPEPFPLPPLPPQLFQTLPDDGELLRLAADYYFNDVTGGKPRCLVAAAGTQSIIQALPLLRPACRVAVPAIGYREHAFRWRLAGHEVVEYDPGHAEALSLLAPHVDVLVVINPNNPLALEIAPQALRDALGQLQSHGGWLVVDEAFVDATPALSLADDAGAAGLIVLRSLGKFFGLAGMRCGFALCWPELAQLLRVALGPWAVSGPAQAVAKAALTDRDWQKRARPKLLAASRACGDMLALAFRRFDGETLRSALFNSVRLRADVAVALQEKLACEAIWSRLIELDRGEALLRFGLVEPTDQTRWSQFQRGLAALCPQ